MTKQIPNFFTLLNLIFGCIAIVLALQTQSISIYSGEDFSSSFNIPENLSLAALCLYAAAVVDFLDGFVARLFKASSEMGKQLDSLADVVSFSLMILCLPLLLEYSSSGLYSRFLLSRNCFRYEYQFFLLQYKCRAQW